MGAIALSRRTAKEILRDLLNFGFGLGFPLVLLLLMTAIQSNIPVSLFELEKLTPGIAVFGLAFMTLFSATLISKDRASALLQRLYTTPLRAGDYIAGYMLPILPMAVAQSAICYACAFILGLEVGVNILVALLVGILPALLFISLGLLCGSVLTDKQVGGLCGALLTNLTAWLSGVWFDLELVGGVITKIAHALPFYHAVELERAAVAGNYAAMPEHIAWVAGYAVVIFTAAVLLFLRQMKKQ